MKTRESALLRVFEETHKSKVRKTFPGYLCERRVHLGEAETLATIFGAHVLVV